MDLFGLVLALLQKGSNFASTTLRRSNWGKSSARATSSFLATEAGRRKNATIGVLLSFLRSTSLVEPFSTNLGWLLTSFDMLDKVVQSNFAEIVCVTCNHKKTHYFAVIGWLEQVSQWLVHCFVGFAIYNKK